MMGKQSSLTASALAVAALGFLGFARAPGSGAAADSGALAPPVLAAPTGPFAVGTLVVHRSDPRPEDSELGSGPRPLTFQVWYPGASGEGEVEVDAVSSPRVRAPYLFESRLLEAMREDAYLDLAPEILAAWAGIETHSSLAAPLVRGTERLPLVVFSPGFGVARANYTSLLENLASHGYVVVAIDHPHSGLSVTPAGQVLAMAPHPGGPEGKAEAVRQDAAFVVEVMLEAATDLGRFRGRLDPGRIGVFGHSLGGAAALEACRVPSRFRACADLDGSPLGPVGTEGMHRPFLVLLNEPAESKRPPVAMRLARDEEWAAVLRASAAKGTEGGGLVVKVAETNHYSFSDLPFLVPEAVMRRSGATIDPPRVFEIVSRLLIAFFDQHLALDEARALAGHLEGVSVFDPVEP